MSDPSRAPSHWPTALAVGLVVPAIPLLLVLWPEAVRWEIANPLPLLVVAPFAVLLAAAQTVLPWPPRIICNTHYILLFGAAAVGIGAPLQLLPFTEGTPLHPFRDFAPLATGVSLAASLFAAAMIAGNWSSDPARAAFPAAAAILLVALFLRLPPWIIFILIPLLTIPLVLRHRIDREANAVQAFVSIILLQVFTLMAYLPAVAFLLAAITSISDGGLPELVWGFTPLPVWMPEEIPGQQHLPLLLMRLGLGMLGAFVGAVGAFLLPTGRLTTSYRVLAGVALVAACALGGQLSVSGGLIAAGAKLLLLAAALPLCMESEGATRRAWVFLSAGVGALVMLGSVNVLPETSGMIVISLLVELAACAVGFGLILTGAEFNRRAAFVPVPSSPEEKPPAKPQ
jgi:hypothetical protein